MKENTMILGEDIFYSMDTRETKLNNNVLVVGASGAGKTRSIVSPNILQAEGSYVISDPKGNLYDKYGDYLKSKGYIVKKLDFTDPENSEHYNFFDYIKNTQDIVKVAHMLVYGRRKGRSPDPFWEESSQLLLQSLIAFLREGFTKKEQNLHNVISLVNACSSPGDLESSKTATDYLMEKHEKKHPDSYAVRTYRQFRLAADKTLRSILISVNSALGVFDTPELNRMTERDTIHIRSIGGHKTALFVVVSDTDRCMDPLANIFFSQAIHELCSIADEVGGCLPTPVRFIMDDFATNCRIEDFPRIISSIRSRGISTMLMVQAESQLLQGYENDWRTIIANCDTYVYMGGNDLETVRAVSERCDIPKKKIFNMPIGTNWIFRRGEEPVNGRNFDLEKLTAELEKEGYTFDDGLDEEELRLNMDLYPSFKEDDETDWNLLTDHYNREFGDKEFDLSEFLGKKNMERGKNK